MSDRIRRQFCWAVLVLCFAGFSANVLPARAQEKPPVPATPPSNVTAPPRLYIVEGIVVVVLFAGAIFAVCRASGRT